MNFLLDIETAADPAPIAQDNFEELDAFLTQALRALFIATATATVSNTAPATTFIPTGIGSATIAANSLHVGSVVKQRFSGHYTTDAVVAPNFTITAHFGAVTKTFGTQLPANSVNGFQWTLEVDWTIRSIGGAGTVFCQARLLYEDGAGAEVIAYVTPQTATSAIDTTIANLMDAKVAWTVADADNAWSCSQGQVLAIGVY